MDGGSTDTSVEIIKKYESRLAGWVSEKDKGQADAINKGFERSTGEIVAWLNSDDFYLPGAINRAVQAFEQNPAAGLIYGNVLSVDADSRPFNLQTFQPLGLLDLMSFSIISQPAVFIKRSLLDQTGLLDPTLHCLLDHHLWLRIAQIAPLVYIPETLAAARYHVEAKNLARTADFGREAFRIIDWMKTTPGFLPLYEQHISQILSGANRFDAFYLLDGEYFHAALAAYWRAFKLNPRLAIKDWHRIAYGLLAILGLKNLRGPFMRLRQYYNDKSRKNQLENYK